MASGQLPLRNRGLQFNSQEALNPANNHVEVSLEADPSPVKPWDETKAPANTLITAFSEILKQKT